MQQINGNEISGLLIHDLNDPNNPSTYIAESGELIIEKNNRFLRLYNGNIQILNKETQKISEISFESYDLNLAPYAKKERALYYADELSTLTILEKIKKNNYDNEQFAELNNRIISPLYIYCLSLLTLLIFKISRRPDESWFIPILIISISALVIKILEVTFANLLINNNSFYLINYFIPLTITVLIIFLLFRKDYLIK
jgi:lipopolysaccharide export LptBFGC system permease protein LptF